MYVLVNVVIAVLLEKLMGAIMVDEVPIYDITYSGREFIRLTDKNSDESTKEDEDNFIWDAQRSWEPATNAKVDPRTEEEYAVYCHVRRGQWEIVKEHLGKDKKGRPKRVIIKPRPERGTQQVEWAPRNEVEKTEQDNLSLVVLSLKRVKKYVDGKPEKRAFYTDGGKR